MTDFFDWLTASDSGLAADRLREHYRLTHGEMRRTADALAPAFLFGLQRLLLDQSAWTDFMRRFSSLGLDTVTPGLETMASRTAAPLLGRLFGTDLLTDAVARHASMMAGVAPDIIRKIMPDLALMTVQTIMRMASAQGGVDGRAGLPTDTGGQAMAEMMRRSANAVEAFSRPSSAPRAGAGASGPSYLESLFADALRGGFPWMNVQSAGTGAPSQASPAPPLFPFAPLFEAFARHAAGDPPMAASTAQAQKPAPDPFAEMNRLMEAGRSVQETYTLEMLALFDRYRPGAEGKPPQSTSSS